MWYRDRVVLGSNPAVAISLRNFGNPVYPTLPVSFGGDTKNGFKEHGSTNACTFMVKETIQYYLQNSSNVYGTVLDATKAFDRIDFCKLFREMIKRKLPHLLYVWSWKCTRNKAWQYDGTMNIPIRLEFRMVLNKVVYCLLYCSVYILITC